MSWPVAFECLILYLRLIESGSGKYNIGNVVHDCGGIDHIRKQALMVAKDHYSVAFFRTFGGNPTYDKVPEDGNKDDGTKGSKKGGEVFKGTLIGGTNTSKICCAAWNLGNPHLAKNVDANGRCKFLHVCDQFVTDKGKGGQCRGNHKRPDCDYDPEKKCSKAVDA